MGNYLAAIWRCRYFWLSLVKTDLRTRYRRSMLGMGWSLLNPICMTIILCVVFGNIFHQDIRTYAPHVLAGLAFWNFITTATLQGCQCMFQGEQYIRQYPAPLAIYPLRTALGVTIHFLIAMCLVLVLAWGVNGFGNLLAITSLVPTLVLLFFFCWALATLAGFITVYFQDTQHLAEVGFQILFYATPIIYPMEAMKDRTLAWVFSYNPLVPFLNLIREPILFARFPGLEMYGAAGLTVLVTASLSILALVGLQRRLIFQL
jgi:ABC-type polysaccharide/polyol phosphate export permease